MIESKNISVVVQGAIDLENTWLAMQSIRRYFPEAEIILSTWEGSNVDNLPYDQVIFNKDPGGFQDAFAPHFTNNLSRQLVSTQAGIKTTGRKYVLKMRSDICFHSVRILNIFSEFPARNQNYALFDGKIISCAYFTKKYLMNGKKVHPAPFHLSDWLSFGLRSDIEKLYAADIPQEPKQSAYFATHPYRGAKRNLMGASHQYAPEQYILFHAVQKSFPEIKFNDYMDFDRENIAFSEQVIANNFIVLPPKDLGFVCLKKATGGDTYYKWCRHPLTVPYPLWKGLYRRDVFVKDYQKYCDSSYRSRFSRKMQMLVELVLKEVMR